MQVKHVNIWLDSGSYFSLGFMLISSTLSARHALRGCMLEGRHACRDVELIDLPQVSRMSGSTVLTNQNDLQDGSKDSLVI